VDNAAAEPGLTFKQLEPPANHRPGMLVLLVCVVIATAIAGGVWWKWKTAQLGSEMITGKIAPKSSTAESPEGAASQTPVSTTANPADSASTNPAAADAGEPVLTPATPEELAKFPRVTGVRHWSSADSSTVVLDLEDQVQYEAHRLSGPDRIYFDLHDTQLAPDLAGKSIDVGDALLHRIRVAQPVAGLTRVVLEIKADSNFSVSLEPNPYRLVVEVRKIGATPKGAVNLFPNIERNKLAIVVPPPTREDLQLRAHVPKLRIVVDAGHGGWDLGTVGRRGLLEKDLVLEIAQRLGKLLETRLGADVIFTRNDDSYIPLDDRAEIANQAQADLFVSVHANYSDLPSARGVETYYTNSFSAPASKESGLKEIASKDAASHAGAAKTVAASLSPAELHERVEQSRRLAASVQRALYGTLVVQNPGLRDRGIKEAGFVVLTESAMPGILAEVSFVSSPTDEQKLRSDGYRERIAEALYRGIARYAASSRGVKMASKRLPVAGSQ
jgi:N-acetylmuramoyl-L-alanine amidase